MAFVLCTAIWTAGIPAGSAGFIGMRMAVISVSSVAFLLIVPLAYYLERDTLMWALTRPAIVGGTTGFVAAFGAGATGVVSAGGDIVEESLIGLIAVVGFSLMMTAIPTAVAFLAVMLVHGAGGRSSGPEAFPEE
jgi:type IV secretory pathway VirB3-like protein